MFQKKIWVASIFLISSLIFTGYIVGCGTVTEKENAAPQTVTEKKASDNVKLTLASSPSSSALYTYQVSWAKAVSEVYPEIAITVMESGGAADSMRRTRDRMANIGNSTAGLIYQSYHGEGEFEGTPKDNLRMLFSQPPGAYQIVVSERSGITKIQELSGKRFNPGGAGTSATLFVKKTFDLLGIQPTYFEAAQSDAADAISNRQIVGVVKYGPTPDSFISQIQASLPIRVLSLTAEEIGTIKKSFPWILDFSIASGTYGNTEVIQTIGDGAGTFATTDMDVDVAYKIASAYFEKGKNIWQSAYPAYAGQDHIKITLGSRGIPLHAGVVKFLKEKGYNVPEELIPPEF